MKRFAHATPAPKLKKPSDVYVGWACAGLLILMLVSQLFTFEKVAPLIENLDMGGGEPAARVIASVIVIVELFALPFLLRMKLSPLMRGVSMAAGWIAVLMWLYMAIISLALPGLRTIGLFGSIVPLAGGAMSLLYVILLAGLLLWATAVLWPTRRTLHRRKK